MEKSKLKGNSTKYAQEYFTEKHSNPIKFIVHLLIGFGSDSLFSFGNKKNKHLVLLHG